MKQIIAKAKRCGWAAINAAGQELSSGLALSWAKPEAFSIGLADSVLAEEVERIMAEEASALLIRVEGEEIHVTQVSIYGDVDAVFNVAKSISQDSVFILEKGEDLNVEL